MESSADKQKNTDSGITKRLGEAKKYLENAKEYVNFAAKIVDGVISDPKKLDDSEIDSFIEKNFGQTGREFYNIFKKHYLKNSAYDKAK